VLTDEELGAAFRKIVLAWPALVGRLRRCLLALEAREGTQSVCNVMSAAIVTLQEELENASKL
jgi:hypothetical protein